jgi:hypothetical protein
MVRSGPLDLFRNFYSPLALDATVGQGGIDISRTENGYTVEIPGAGFRPEGPSTLAVKFSLFRQEYFLSGAPSL